ncbi:hypothetical protein [Microbulbifer sp. TYP-18]|uniref:hypothetical protein n=1 Tax=Microbulbifer sp. TYP-18 TaxID=3230024 RepID=UPI0034C65BE6
MKIFTNILGLTVVTLSAMYVGASTANEGEMSNEKKGEILGAAVGALTAPVTTKGGSEEIGEHVQDFQDAYGAAGKEMDEKENSEKNGD